MQDGGSSSDRTAAPVRPASADSKRNPPGLAGGSELPGGIDSGATGSTERPGQPSGDRGVLQPLAAKVLMKILYAARMARFDLLRAVCDLACFVTKWTEECDRKLHRLICYIATTKHHRQIGWIGDRAEHLAPHLFADADFAGCKVLQRSTGGGHLAIMGPNSCFPQAGKSSKHGAVSSSTPESELYSGHIIMKAVGIPAKTCGKYSFAATFPCTSTKTTRP